LISHRTKRAGGAIRIAAGVLALAGCCAWALAGPAPQGTTLRRLRDHQRVLLIFAASRRDARVEEQLAAIREKAAEAADRDLVTIAVTETGDAGTGIRLTDAAAVRRRFGVKAGEFRVILVGKDGGEKLRSERPIAFERLRATIDAMPMRQEEMREKKRE
jgi:hypothetical protein